MSYRAAAINSFGIKTAISLDARSCGTRVGGCLVMIKVPNKIVFSVYVMFRNWQ
jgi:hypothetical protein